MSDQHRLDQLLLRWKALTEQGLRPTAAEMCADCPELTGAFEQRLLGMEKIAALLKPPATSSDEKALLAETSDGTSHGTGLREALGQAAEPERALDDAATRARLSFLDPPDEPGCLGRLGPYRVLEMLGEGGMGIVFKAEESQPRRLVAIKVVQPERATPQSRQRFLREGQALASVDHERVVAVYRVDEFRDVPFLVMPLLQGESLRARLKGENRLPLAEVLRIGREIAEGLAAAHSSGVIHRDIKPANIWLRGPEQRVVLLDFGLARPVFGQDEQGADLTSVGSVLGTAGYMAPEQAAGQAIDARADLFSLGCVLYELATGLRPFTGPDPLAILSALANDDPPPPRNVNPKLPAALSALIVKLLAKSPNDRLQSAGEVISALGAIERRDDEIATTTALPVNCRADGPVADSGGGEARIADALRADIRSVKTREEGPRVKRPLASGLAAMVLVAAAIGWIGWRVGNGNAGSNSLSGAAPSAQSSPEPQVHAVAAPLRVLSIDVRQYARTDAGHAREVGLLAKDSIAPRLGDLVRIEAKLSRRAYAYLLAFRPDGEVELCFPEDKAEPPPLTDEPRYPPESAQSDVFFGLKEGTGLWVFAVVASEQPLPAYRYLIANQKPDWSPPVENVMGVDSFSIWQYDGEKIELLNPSGTAGGVRGKGEKAVVVGRDDVLRAVQWLKAATHGEATAAIGFEVAPQRQVPLSLQEAQ